MRTYTQAVAYAEGQRLNPSRDWTYLCQMFARSCVGADAWAGTALDAWREIPESHKHRDSTPRAGSLLYFGTSRPGHVVFMVDNGYCYSNDIITRGKISKVPWTMIVTRWNMPKLGWIDWTPSGAINLKPITDLRPTVDLPLIQAAAKRDPGNPAGTYYRSGTLVVERAMVKDGYLSGQWDDGHFGTETRKAYAKVQARFKSPYRDGIPRQADLTAYGKARGFKVVA